MSVHAHHSLHSASHDTILLLFYFLLQPLLSTFNLPPLPEAASSHPSQLMWVETLQVTRSARDEWYGLVDDSSEWLLSQKLTSSVWWPSVAGTRAAPGLTAVAGCSSPPAPVWTDGYSAWWPESLFVRPSWPVCLHWTEQRKWMSALLSKLIRYSMSGTCLIINERTSAAPPLQWAVRISCLKSLLL